MKAVTEWIKEYPTLYDTMRPDYKDQKNKDKIWDGIGEKLRVMPLIPNDLRMAHTSSHELHRAVTTMSHRETIPPCRYRNRYRPVTPPAYRLSLIQASLLSTTTNVSETSEDNFNILDYYQLKFSCFWQ
jgi:hypothetical protein